MTTTEKLSDEQLAAMLFTLGEYARSIAPAWAIVYPVKRWDDQITVRTRHAGRADSCFNLSFRDGEAAIGGPSSTSRTPAQALRRAAIMHGLAVLGAAMESQWKQASKEHA